MGSTRIKGTKLGLKLDDEDHWADALSVVLDNEEADAETVTFEDAAAGGGRTYFILVTALQSTAATSFWSFVWDQTGETVPYVYAPHGNAIPSVAEPHFTGELVVGPRPKIGGEAGRDKTYTFETRFDCTAEPVKVTAPPEP